MIDFSKLGKVKLGDIPAPVKEPGGTYSGVIRSWKWAESRWKNKETGQAEAQVHVMLKPTEFLLRADGEPPYGDELVEVKLSEKVHVAELSFNGSKDEYYMQELLLALGVHVAGRTVDECLPDIIGLSAVYDLVAKETDRGTMLNVRRLRAQ